VHITVDGNWTVARPLRQECDDLVEIGGAHLRPFVDLIAGAEPARHDEDYQAGAYPGRSMANGHGAAAGAVTHQGLPAAALPAPPAIYTAPVVSEYQRNVQPLPERRPGSHEQQEPDRGQPGGVPAQQGGRQAPPGGMHQGHSGELPRQPGDLASQPGDLPGQPAGMPGQQADLPGQSSGPLGQPAGPPRTDSSQVAFPGLNRPDAQSGSPRGAPAGDDQGSRMHGGQAYPAHDQFLDARAAPASDGPAGPEPGQHGGSQRHALGGAPPQYLPAPGGQYGRSADQLPPGQYSGPQHGQHSGGTLGPAFSSPQGAPYSGPQPAASQLPVPQPVAVSLADAVQAAHAEGFGFGEAVARDAPALWLEAVLARKPRMPSDLEARLLQGSALPIDSLLHDEVRHALRRGFWDALERSRR
jgi:hypothetical protein